MSVCSISMQSATMNDSLVGIFCYKPFDTNVDWSMVAKASPCYVTVSIYFIVLLVLLPSLLAYLLITRLWQYLKDTVDQIVNFFQSNTTFSQTIALEAAAAVQVLFNLCWFIEKWLVILPRMSLP